MTSLNAWILLFTVLLSGVGCSSPPSPSKQMVEGKVTVNGELLSSGMIFFFGETKEKVPVEKGASVRGGIYVIGDRDAGLPPGEYKVQILREGEPQLPLRYSSRDGDLRATIVEGGRKDCDFVLTDP